jgi:polar amino acid transport system substrate-binding protein
VSRKNILSRAAAALGAAALVVTLAACAGGATASSDGYLTAGKLTIGTSDPAFSPWVIDNKPQTGKGFESAVAYAVADKLGFAKKDVVWVRQTFDKTIAPGKKDFDFNLQQFSISAERAKAVDFSTPYYETSQVVVTIKKSPAASASSIADLKGLLIGAQTGTTSFAAIEQQIKPTRGAQAFNTNDDAKLALKNGTVDAIVVDLPTAFYITGDELAKDGGTIVGQLPKAAGKSGDKLGLVLAKGSPLTKKVSDAVDALRADGTLQKLADTWLSDAGGAPVLK